MNVWRWLGISIFLLATVCLISTTKLPAYAGGEKDAKDKKTDVKKDDTKKDAKKTDESKKKTEEPKKKAEEPKKKAEEPKKKAEEPKKTADAGGFKAFDPGKPFFQVQQTKTKQKMVVMNQAVEQKQDQTFVIQWTPKEKKDGNYVVTQKIVGIKMDIDIGGNKISYDSTQKNPKNPMTDFFEQLSKAELTFIITPDLKVKNVEGRDEFIKGLIDINPQMQGLLKNILSEKALQKMAEPTWYAYPEGGKFVKDQTWKKVSELDLGPIGIYKTNFDFTNKGQEGSKYKIGIKTTLDYTAPTEKSGLPFIIQKASLKSDSGEGEAIFDPAKGRFDSSKITMKLSGQLTIEVGNMTTNVELTQTQEADSTTFDANPWEKKGQ